MAISQINAQNLGKFLQIAFSDGIRNQISEDYRDWEMVKRCRVGDPDGRQLQFLFQTSFGPSAIQYSTPGSAGSFPEEQQITSSEHTATYKEIDVTIGIEYNLWNRARKSPAKYAEPLAIEIQSKTVAAKRRLAADLYGDGTGVVGECDATANTPAALSGTDVEFTLFDDASAKGWVGFFEYGDILELVQKDGTTASTFACTLALAPGQTGNTTLAYWKVISKDRKNKKVTLRPLNSTLGELEASGAITQPGGGIDREVFYRYGQPTYADVQTVTSPGDYGSCTEVIPGLASLASADGRTIHGITMSGPNAATVLDAGATALDVSQVREVMDQCKIAVGPGSYSWKQMVGAPEAHAAFIESREADRRFHSMQDNARGLKVFGYQHDNDFLEMVTSEYVPVYDMYFQPEAKGGNKVIEYHGTDYEPVKVGNMPEFHLRPGNSGGTHQRRVVTYLEALGTLICKHPAAIARLRNFTV